MASKSKIGPKGQITIPKELREKYHFQEGEEILLLAAEGGVLVKHPTSRLRGRLRGRIDISGFEEDLEALRNKWKI